MKSVQLTVHGIVQGVFFRKYTVEKAFELGVVGTVRNNEDSTVGIEATGDEKNLAAFIAWCHRGPARAKVNHVDIHELPKKNFPDFRVVR